MKRKNLYLLTILLVLAVAVLIYGRSLGYGTVNWDDALSRKGTQADTIFSWSGFVNTLGVILRTGGTLQPVRDLTSFLLAGAAGPDVWWPYHLVSLVFYLGTVLFFYLTVRLLFGRIKLPGGPEAGEWGALLATAFFAFHPGHVEVAGWVLGQKDALVGFFYLGALYFYLRSPVTTRRDLVVSLLLYALALGSKPSAVCLALVPPLYDRIFRPGLFKAGYISKLAAVYSLYFLPAAAAALYFISTTARIGAVGGLEDPLRQMLKVAGALSFSAFKLILPVNLSLRYPAFDYGGFNGWQMAFYSAAALLILYWVVKAYRERMPYAFFACWALLALLPNLNLVPIRIERADRYYYLASMGFSGLAGYAGVRLVAAAAGARKAVLVSLLLVLSCLALVSARQVGYWRDGPAAWGRALTIYPDFTLARVALGHSYLGLGAREQALRAYRPLLEGGTPNVEALKGTAVVLADRGDTEQAVSLLELGRRLAPGDYELVEILAGLLVRSGRLEQARELAALWAAAEPWNPEAGTMLAELCLRLGRHGEAGRVLDALFKQRPQDVELMNRLALVHLDRQESGEAERLLRQAVKLNPDYTEAWMNLARLYASSGRANQAAGIYSRYQADRLDLEGLEFMGALYHERGNLERALAYFLEITRRWPHLAKGYNNAGVICELAGRYPAADSLYLRAIELDTLYIDAFFNRGNLLRLRGDPAGALRHYLRADSLAGRQDAAILEALAATFRELGEQAAAERCLDRLKALERRRP
ncbi:MAG: tetratricopeptide repeat protein [Candidatus Glassbacteria bacterium]|nr:tetratricopeptide repeat protein [Candidatus Glassbacteria bacterium]